MPIGLTERETGGFGSNSGLTSYGITLNQALTANQLAILVVGSRVASGTANEPTASGGNVTWVVEESLTSGSVARLTVFRAMGASPTGTSITIDFGGQTQENCIAYCYELDGVDTSGTNGSGAVIQSASAQDNSNVNNLHVTLASFADATNNVCFGAFYCGDNVTMTAGSGFTGLTQNLDVTESSGCRCQWKTGEDTDVEMTTGTTEFFWIGVALEIKMAATAGGINKLRGLLGGKLIGKTYQ